MSVKAKRTFIVAICVSSASMIRLNVITEGFIVALSVLVMEIFIYCYEDLAAGYIAVLSGIFSPFFRLMITFFQEDNLDSLLPLILPDMGFFFTYAIVFTVICKYIYKKPKSIKTYPFIICACDFLSNCEELTVRSVIADEVLLTVKIIAALAIIAVVRTLLVQMILMAIETYSNFLVDEEHNEEYKKLLIQASVFYDELHLMDKNVADIESVMKNAYELNQNMQKLDVPEVMKNMALNIAKNAHEVKGDYLSIISFMKHTYVGKFNEADMKLSQIFYLEKMNINSIADAKDWQIDVVSKIKADFVIKDVFAMMSVLRNLLINAVEAIGDEKGTVFFSTHYETASQTKAYSEYYADNALNEIESDSNKNLNSNETSIKSYHAVSKHADSSLQAVVHSARDLEEKKDNLNCVITIRDSGSGVDKDEIDDIFLPGFTTKFDSETGEAHRGLGMSLVKNYVEDKFHGRMEIESEKGKYTEIRLILPMAQFGWIV